MENSRTDRMSGEIDWPSWAERTPKDERSSGGGFSVTLARACKDIKKEMERLDVDGWRLSTAASHRQSDGLPYRDASPSDPGVVLRWTKDEDQRAVPCDYYNDLRDNVREVGLYIKEKRKVSQRNVVRGQDEFATAALPPGDDEGYPEVSVNTPEEAAEILGLTSPDVPERLVEVAVQEKKKQAHPDSGEGGRRELALVLAAEEVLL